MKKLALGIGAAVALFAIQSVAAHEEEKIPAQSVERVCTGQLTDMRELGVTLGDCDLNHVSDGDFTYIKIKCGEPWTLESNADAKRCSIDVISSRSKLRTRPQPEFGAPLFRVFKVLS